MNCWHCNTELIWGGDHDITPEENDEPAEEDGAQVVESQTAHRLIRQIL